MKYTKYREYLEKKDREEVGEEPNTDETLADKLLWIIPGVLFFGWVIYVIVTT